ncbi:hypothetical protein COCCU_10620 [Corynebacterium occultum]|uniref:Uncharacterized protein n=1 Tax=Corynebacterium occultum TaxID=2675219 RepID=A0A6B8VV82_9CORY|nr:hypothetical protein [Corynebacterium occultum]QGU08043.1 hypothetical protein COCCU_10620 [Corynebacterium occultum]
MRGLYLGLAAVFCVAALATNFFDIPRFIAIAAIVIAGIFLVLGLRATAENREPAPIELDAKKKATIRAMLERGDEGAAIRQVQLWFRDTTSEEARRAVQGMG